MSEFVKVAMLGELPPGRCMEAQVGTKTLALCNVDGRVHAVANRCPHRGGPLGQGGLDGPILMCPWHAWTFDVTTGENTESPELTIEVYEARVVGDEVQVRVPESAG